MTRNILRFPLSADDQNRINTTSPITVKDDPAAAPQSLYLRFIIKDPDKGAPVWMPLFPGSMRFLADSRVPDGKVGRMLMSLDPIHQSKIDNLPGVIQPIPTHAWCWPILVPDDFLNETLAHSLPKEKVQLSPKGSIPTTDPTWPTQAAAGFLDGTHPVRLRIDSTDPAKDDALLSHTPTFEMDATTGQVELWIAIASANPVDDAQDDALATVAGSIPDTDITHPKFGPLQTRDFFRRLRKYIFGAENGNKLADEVLADWPATPRYFSLRFSLPGDPAMIQFSGRLPAGTKRIIYFSGLLPTQQYTVQEVNGTVVQQGRIPTHGIITIAQIPPSAGQPEPAPPKVDVTVTGNLRVTDTTGSPSPVWNSTVRVDFSTLQDNARIVLQPAFPSTGSADDPETYSENLADLTSALGGALGTPPSNVCRSPKTVGLYQVTLKAYEDWIRPTSWSNNTPVLLAARKPWTSVSREDLIGLFNGLQKIAFSIDPPPVPVRTAEAMALWIMEGKIKAREDRILVDSANKQWIDFDPDKTPIASLHQFPPAAIAGATIDKMKRLIRVLLLWSYWGLDIMNYHAKAHDNFPLLSGDLDTALKLHDDQMTNRALTAIATAGVVAPTREMVTDTIQVQPVSSGKWHFTTAPNHIETMVWLQYAEYLRRLTRLPTDAAMLPAFGYMAYNGGIEKDPTGWDDVAKTWEIDPQKLFWQWWADVTQEYIANPVTWSGKNQEDVLLMKWRLSSTIPDALHLPPREFVRVNGLNFSTIVHGYGAVYPHVIRP